MTSAILSSIYSDDLVTATDLNRQPGRILDKALDNPVTITRNDQFFALLRREEVTSLAKATQHSKIVIEILSTAYRLLLGREVGCEHSFYWLKVFDQGELQEFIDEIQKTYYSATLCARRWDELDATIHEWHESALAIASPEVAIAFSDKFDEVPLTQPITENVT